MRRCQVKFLHVLGTRPNLIKFVDITGEDYIVWTGQHYDKCLEALPVPEKAVCLGKTTLGAMTEAIKDYIETAKPNAVLVYGDTRSTLAGALAANELNVPLVHIEAGLRLYDNRRPEERIRRMVDDISDYLFCPTQTAYNNLKQEMIRGKVFLVGDIHYDRYVENRKHDGYILATIHRAENTSDEESLRKVLGKLRRKEKVIFPMHPRTKNKMEGFGIKLSKNIEVLEPLKYEEMQEMIKNAKLVLTDSGGVSREAWFAGTPVEILGKSEWPEINSFGKGNARELIREILLKEEI